MGQGLARPPHKAHRISFGLEFLLQIGQQRRIGLHQLFLSTPSLANTLSWLIALARFQFSETSFYRIERDTRFTCHDARASSLLCFYREILSPLFLIAPRPFL